MHDLPDMERLDLSGIPDPELEAAQVGRKRRCSRVDHRHIDESMPQEHRGYDECE